ncbi:MAG: hypothetical protein K940chlam6_00937 [Chlamydiae bacterium]|nr:hypothetical protein [Chlamydiota bacterium]
MDYKALELFYTGLVCYMPRKILIQLVLYLIFGRFRAEEIEDKLNYNFE